MKRKYRIAPASALSDKRRNPSMLLSHTVDREDSNIIPAKSQRDIELAKMRRMSPQEAAAVAARAVAEAEAAIAEAEEAAKVAEAAEADAEAAQAFAEAAMKTLKGSSTTTPRMVISLSLKCTSPLSSTIHVYMIQKLGLGPYFDGNFVATLETQCTHK